MKKTPWILFNLALVAALAGCDNGSDTPTITDGDVTDTSGDTSADDDTGGTFLSCDASGDCWGACYGCAITGAEDPANTEPGKEGMCYEVYQACMADTTCSALNTCIGACPVDDADDTVWFSCYETCLADNGCDGTASSDMYHAIDTCILCEACPQDCAADATPEDCM